MRPKQESASSASPDADPLDEPARKLLFSWRRRLLNDPTDAIAYLGLGQLLRELDRADEAVNLLQGAVRRLPHSVELWVELGLARQHLPDPAGALESFAHALALHPECAVARYNYGNQLLRLDRVAEARRQLERLQAECPGAALTRLFEGQCHYWSSDLDAAEVAYRRALRTAPGLTGARSALGRCLLVQGRYPEGFAEFEAVRARQPTVRRYSAPEWQGEALTGKRLLVHPAAGEGLGDILQMARYVPTLTTLGADVVFQCPSRLHRVLARMQGMPRLLSWGTKPVDCDWHVTTFALPRLLGTQLQTVPLPSPLTRPLHLAPEVARELGIARDGQSLTVGLAWAGNPRHANDHARSIDLSRFATLLGVSGVTWLSLQVGPRADEASRHSPGLRMPSRPPRDFLDTALLMSQLDLVISVDTSVAHLAGVLGYPVWTLIAEPPEWRWLARRSDTPWYPSMTLCRQTTPGDWTHPLETARAHLASWVQAGRQPG